MGKRRREGEGPAAGGRRRTKLDLSAAPDNRDREGEEEREEEEGGEEAGAKRFRVLGFRAWGLGFRV
jgi:hypothetical protein